MLYHNLGCSILCDAFYVVGAEGSLKKSVARILHAGQTDIIIVNKLFTNKITYSASCTPCGWFRGFELRPL